MGCTKCAADQASMSQDTFIEVKDPVTDAWTTICGVQNITGPSSARQEVEVTTLCSKMREFLTDLPDPGTVELSGVLLFGDEGQIVLESLFRSGEIAEYRITLEDKAYTAPVTIEFNALVLTMPFTFSQGAAKAVSFTLRLSGEVTITRPTVPTP